GLLLPAERNKTLTALAIAEPIEGGQHRQVQGLQWFLSESMWDPQEVNQRRLEQLRAEPSTGPDDRGSCHRRGDEEGEIGARQTNSRLGVSGSVVLRMVMVWLEPWTMLWRSWGVVNASNAGAVAKVA
ncbi:MAG TPA: hypothetical protein VGR16_08535, partial [Thermomicrobiales bacterium]|nr:hypothetical protein [Thermomicrobiales bacterium]